MLTYAEEINLHLIGKDGFIDHIADDLRVRFKAAVAVRGDVAECVQPEIKRGWHTLSIMPEPALHDTYHL